MELVDTVNCPPKALAKPPVPFVAPVLMVQILVAKPLMLEKLPKIQFVLVVETKLRAAPLVSGPMPESDQRLMLNLLPEFAVMENAPVEKVS